MDTGYLKCTQPCCTQVHRVGKRLCTGLCTPKFNKINVLDVLYTSTQLNI